MTTEEVLIQPYVDKFRLGVAKYKEAVAIYLSIPSPSEDIQNLYIVNTQILAELYQAFGPYLTENEKAEIENLIGPVEGVSGLGFWFIIPALEAIAVGGGAYILGTWITDLISGFKSKGEAETAQAKANEAAIAAGYEPSWITQAKSFFEKVLGISPGTVITVAALVIMAPYVLPEIKKMLKGRKNSGL